MVGKRVSGDLYVHRTAIKHLENEDGLLVTEYMKKLEANERKWNVVRLGNDNIAFLQYPQFLLLIIINSKEKALELKKKIRMQTTMYLNLMIPILL